VKHLAVVALLVLVPVAALTSPPPASRPAPGEIPDSPHFWRAWEAAAKTEAARRAAEQPAPAQASPAQFLYDVHFYDLALDLDPAAELLTGTVAVRATVTGAVLPFVDLDLSSVLVVDGVRADGAATTFTHELDRLRVTLPRDYLQGETVTVAVDYHGNPALAGGSFGWAWADSYRMVWTLSEPFGARTWWPCKDLNEDKADSVDLHVAVPAAMKVASNGLLAGEETVGDRKIYHWQERYPICTYLVSVTACDYVVFTDTYTAQSGQAMPIVNYVIPTYESQARAGYAITADMIAAFAEGFGEYPFLDEKYGHAHFIWGGGMEHQTCTSLLYWFYGQGIIAHELAHQWWGDLVTCKTFHHIWLNEGFATWAEAYWKEQSSGMAAYHQEMAGAEYLGPGTIYVENPADFNSIFDGNLSYNKASWVVHMLRGALGDGDFFAGLALYRERFAYGAATTEDLQAVMEEVSGRDLGPFFQQWIYREGYPRYYYNAVLTPQGDHTLVQLRIDQIQDEDVFVMPIKVRLTTDVGAAWTTVENDRRVQNYSFTWPGPVYQVQLDPEKWILRQMLGGGTVDVPDAGAGVSLAVYPNPFNPRATLRLSAPAAGPARLDVFDAAGRRVRSLLAGDVPAGSREVVWDGLDGAGRAAPAGVYFAVAEVAGGRSTARLTLVR